MRILDAYIYKKLSVYLLIIFPSFSIVSALIELIEILKKAKTIEFSTLTLYILTKLPENAYYIIPISLIVASFMFINDLIKSREIYPIILNGISLNYISIRVILFSILVVVLQVINLETVMPKTNQIYQTLYLKLKNQQEDEKVKGIAYKMWLKIGENQFLYFDFFDLNSKVGKKLIFISLDKEFNPIYRLEAEDFKVSLDKIEVSNGRLIKINSLDNIIVEKFDKKILDINVDVENIKKIILAKKPVSISELYKIASISQAYGYESYYFWSKFYEKLATVIAPFILTVFILGFIWTNNKLYIALGFLATVLYWYGTSLISAVAEVGNIPYFSIFFFDVVFLMIGFYMLNSKKVSFS